MKECIIVIPIYRVPQPDELVSLRRCCEVLYAHDMALVAPQNLDVSCYEKLWQTYHLNLRIQRFDNVFFDGIKGYNRLLLSELFYKAFSSYKYMLIYQPDAYVFKDDLLEWCNKGYDFIGAPLVGNYKETKFHKNMTLNVGNGGFCLRNIDYALKFFSGRHNVFSVSQIARKIQLRKKPYTRLFLLVLMMLGWRNKPHSVTSNWKYNEDNFWSMVLTDSQYTPKLPTPEEALEFAFERFPSKMFERIGHMPFGCHAWKKYEYNEFWKKFIH